MPAQSLDGQPDPVVQSLAAAQADPAAHAGPVTDSKIPAANSSEQSSSALPQNDNLYLRGLPADITERTLDGLFSPYGTITSLKVQPSSGKPTTVGYVKFSTIEEAVKVC